MLEGLMLVASALPPRTGPRDEALRRARVCYDHIAGRLGVGLADALGARGWVRAGDDAGVVTPAGVAGLDALGVRLAPSPAGRSGRAAPLCGFCLDWSERRPHLAGRLGAALLDRSLSAGWVRRREGSRALDITPAGSRAYREGFGVAATE